MLREKIILPLVLISFVITTSCGQNEDLSQEVESIVEENQAEESKQRGNHSYGGWYCPDNLGGFPPVDIQDLESVPVVNGRLPTREETQNGSSLMYFDSEEHPDAMPLDMVLPKLARYYSPNTKREELIIVIQAVTIERDTVVGFRYVNGGNGSAWLDEVSFLSDQEKAQLGPTPFVFMDLSINASKEEIWKTVVGTDYGKKVSSMFEDKPLVQSMWKPDAFLEFYYDEENVQATGSANSFWGNIYLQIDYTDNGDQSTEKVLILQNEDGNSASLQIVAGPYSTNFEQRAENWEKWLDEVKVLAEKN